MPAKRRNSSMRQIVVRLAASPAPSAKKPESTSMRPLVYVGGEETFFACALDESIEFMIDFAFRRLFKGAGIYIHFLHVIAQIFLQYESL